MLQADIYYYLNKKLDDNYDTIKNLEEQTINEQLDREISERKYEKMIDELKAKNIQGHSNKQQLINNHVFTVKRAY